jgi:hypothetical protein
MNIKIKQTIYEIHRQSVMVKMDLTFPWCRDLWLCSRRSHMGKIQCEENGAKIEQPGP